MMSLYKNSYITALFIVLSGMQILQVHGKEILLDNKEVRYLGEALKQAKDGSIIELAAGEYNHAGVLTKNNVTIRGTKGTKIYGKAAQGKAAIVIKGNNTLVENIECYDIQVKDKNGACIRLEGKHLTLNNVYFHDSQQGVLTGSHPGKVIVKNSRFEGLGKAGRAHGIYMGGGKLLIEDSEFLNTKDQGHAVKSRAIETVIRNSTIASLNGNDSRLIDIPNGGILQVYDSILEQGPNSVNWNLIGYGLEGHKHKVNAVTLIGNIVLLDREKGNHVLQMKDSKIATTVEQNVFIGKMKDKFNSSNIVLEDRSQAQLESFPFLPPIQH